MFKYLCRSGREIILKFPSKMMVCPRCEGRGSYVNPNVDGNGIDPQEFVDDPEFRENYFSGLYDVECEKCKGANVVPTVDEDRLTSGQRWRFELWKKSQRELEQMEREDRQTLYWESGGIYGER